MSRAVVHMLRTAVFNCSQQVDKYIDTPVEIMGAEPQCVKSFVYALDFERTSVLTT